MPQNHEIRKMSREALARNWGTAILACILVLIFTGIIPNILSDDYGFILILLISGPFDFGLAFFFLTLIREKKSDINNIFSGFKLFGQTLGLFIVMLVFIILWSLLLIIPGIIAAYSYSMAFFIMVDNKDITVMDAIRQSKTMMYGHKTRLFTLHLSFLGWILLSIISCGIGFVWVGPYIKTAQAIFYNELKNESFKKIE
ncbi:MAG: DUF975 family protein [Candidatus Cloacimonetes bacterium]|nr:DUF975 family protein [Candidatus Cloacimonadota bacterium]MBL7086958.1 DUF975 family protein [Candidatus Cloacimonadota bacterium]